MRQKVLKALANPPRIFYVPYLLAILNFLFWFILFVISMVIFLIIPPHQVPIFLPLIFLGLVTLSHSIFGVYSRQDPQISQIIFAKIKIIKNKIPKKLVV